MVRWLDRQPYTATLHAMQDYTRARDADSPDEVWLLDHPPIFTQGQNGKPEHLLQPGDIPVVQTDRGGQVTYHGPGQLMIYTLIDLKRKQLHVRQFVNKLLQAVAEMLAQHHISTTLKQDAPGLYVEDKKICSIGLRVRGGCTYHGMALNVDMDLEPFQRIHPCGFAGLQMTQCRELGQHWQLRAVGLQLLAPLAHHLAYPHYRLAEGMV